MNISVSNLQLSVLEALPVPALIGLAVFVAVFLAIAIDLIVMKVKRGGKKSGIRREEKSAPAPKAQVREEAPVAEPVRGEEPEEEQPAAPAKRENFVKAVYTAEHPEGEEESEDDDDEEEQGVAIVDGKEVRVIYRKSFLARLIQSKPEMKERYAELANYILSYGLHGRVSWNYHSFNKGREQLFKLNVRGKTLCLYMALNPAAAYDEKYGIEVSDTKKYEKTPCLMRIKSNRKTELAKEMIAEMLSARSIEAGELARTFKAEDYPYDTRENLIKRELIKFTVIEGRLAEGVELVQADISRLMREKVTADEAHNLIDDQSAKKLVKHEIRPGGVRKSGRRFAVNVDTLSDNFASGDTVTLAALKAKKLVPQSEKAIKVLARGTLDKKLTVYADDYSDDAIKMIVLTSGTAIKI